MQYDRTSVDNLIGVRGLRTHDEGCGTTHHNHKPDGVGDVRFVLLAIR